MRGNIWADPTTFITDPQEATAVLRQLELPRIDHYLQALAERGGIQLPHLKKLSANTLVALSGNDHLQTRRTLAAFFSRRALADWQVVIAQAVEHALEHLQNAPSPDLVDDFSNILFLELMPRLMGLSSVVNAEHFEAIRTVQRISEPYLSLATLRQMETAVLKLVECCDAAQDLDKDGPQSLLTYLEGHRDQLPASLDTRYLTIGILAGANSATQTVAFALHGLLNAGRERWIEAAAAGWAEQELERVLSLYPTTRTLVRVANEDTEVAGCPYHRGQVSVLDIVEINSTLRNTKQPGPLHMSFGSGAHKCLGSELATMLLTHAIPAIARRFPDLQLHKDACLFAHTPMLQAPQKLPCDLGGGSRRVSSRMCDIREREVARELVNDNRNFSPPRMEEHLCALARGSSRDLSTAISVARNAMFFMDGERHLDLRRAVADRLGGNRLGAWEPVIGAAINRALDNLATQQAPDLAKDFAERLRADVISRILGVFPQDQNRFEELAPGLQDVLAPWLSLRELERVQGVFREALDAMLEMPAEEPAGLLQALLANPPTNFTDNDLKAATLVLYGATFTLSHTLANILYSILVRPAEERGDAASPTWIDTRIEELIVQGTAPKYIYRMARQTTDVAGLMLQPGDTARLPLLAINRGQSAGHLSFGHGLHRCIGAALSRLLIRRAIPALFSRYPNVALIPQGQLYHPMSQTVALRALPCRLGSNKEKLR